MPTKKELLVEFINAVIDLHLSEEKLKESMSATVSSMPTGATSSTSVTLGSTSTSANTSTVNANSALRAGEEEIDSASNAEQEALTQDVEDNKTSIRQAGEVAGKVSASTLKMKASNMNIKAKQQQIADANKVLSTSETKLDREKAFNDVSQASADMAGELDNVVNAQDVVVNAFRRQSDAANKMKP